MTAYYKVLTADNRSGHGGDLAWSLPTANGDGTWTPGAWHEVAGPVRVCERGLHLTTEPMRWPLAGMRVYRAEGGGDAQTDGDKTAFRRARLLAPADEAVPSWWRDVESFVASIAAVPWFRPQGDPDPAWIVFETRAAARDAVRGAAWGAAGDAARAATRAATRDAAGDAAGDAARDAVRGASWGAAWGVAWAAAGGAAWGAAWRAAGDAAGAAALLARCLVVGDVLAPEHLAHARARWDVWQRGYGLYGDVDGGLYVYRETGR